MGGCRQTRIRKIHQVGYMAWARPGYGRQDKFKWIQWIGLAQRVRKTHQAGPEHCVCNQK